MKFVSLSKDKFNFDKSFEKTLFETDKDEYFIFKRRQKYIQSFLEDVFYSHNKVFNDKTFERKKLDCWIVCVDNRKIVGMIFFEPINTFSEFKNKPNEFWYIKYVTVDKTYEKQGIGKKLYLNCLKEIASKGANYVSANFVGVAGKKTFCSVSKLLNETPYSNFNNFDLTINLEKEKLYNIESKNL